MKLRILAAASALAVAGVAFAVYRETRPDTDTTAAADSPTPVERAGQSPSTATANREPPRLPPAAVSTHPVASPTASMAPAPSPTTPTSRKPSLPRPSGPSAVDATSRAAKLGSRDATRVGSAQPTRAELKKMLARDPRDPAYVDPSSPEAVAARKQRMNRTLESAACHAPDLQQRYDRLPENERAALRARCAKYGVTLTDPG